MPFGVNPMRSPVLYRDAQESNGTSGWSTQTCAGSVAAQTAICLFLASKMARKSNTDRQTNRQDLAQGPHLETVGLEVNSIKGHAVAGLLHRAQVQEGVLGLGPSSSRGPVIQSAGGDS